MLKVLQRICDNVNRTYETLASGFLVMVLISTALQVFTRYVLNSSLSWTEELARYTFIWLNMLGASVGVKYGSHAAIDILSSKLKGRAKKIHILVINGAVLIGGLIMVVEGFKMVVLTSGQPSPAMGLPIQLIYLAVPVGGIGILINTAMNIVKAFLSGKEEVK